MELKDWIKGHQGTIKILILFILLTALMTYPLILHLTDHLPDNLGDPLLNTWILAWDVHQIFTDPINLFNANIFHPHQRTLAYSEHLIGSSLLAMPIILFTKNVILAYNFVFLFSFFVSALGMFLLVRHLTGYSWPAFISALIFAFCPYRFAHLAHLQLLTIQWLPFAFLYLHKFVNQFKYRHLILAITFYVLQCLSCGYYALFTTVFIACFLLLNIKKDFFAWQNIKSFILLSLITVSLLFPLFYPYMKLKKDWGFKRSLEEIIPFSADVQSYLRVSTENKLYGAILADPGNSIEKTLFPGLVCLCLAVLGIIGFMCRGRQLNPKLTEHLPLSSVQGKITFLRNPMVYYLLTAFLAFLFSLGPLIHIHTTYKDLIMGPYALLYNLIPGFDGLRVPARFGIFTMFALSTLAGYGASILLRIKGNTKKKLLLCLIPGLILLEYYSGPIHLVSVNNAEGIPPVYGWLAKQKEDFAIIELPITDLWHETPYMYYSTYHWKKLVNGYSGYYPPLYYYLKDRMVLFPGSEFLRDLQSLGVRYIIWHSQPYPPDWIKWIKGQIGEMDSSLALVEQFGSDYIYELAPVLYPTPSVPSISLVNIGWEVEGSIFDHDAFYAIDDVLKTRWSAQVPQRPGTWFLVDLGKKHPVSGLRIHLERYVTDYPRGYKLEVSTDKQVWKLVKEEKAALPPLLSFALHHKNPIFEIYFPAQEARYLKITQTGSDPVHFWSIPELEILTPLHPW